MYKLIKVGLISGVVGVGLAGCASAHDKQDGVESSATAQRFAQANSWQNRIKQWHLKDVAALKVGTLTQQGQGGDSYLAIIKQFGQPMSSIPTTINQKSVLNATWTNVSGDKETNVALAFVKDSAGQWRLYQKIANQVK